MLLLAPELIWIYPDEVSDNETTYWMVLYSKSWWADLNNAYPKVRKYIDIEWTFDHMIWSVQKCAARNNASIVQQ